MKEKPPEPDLNKLREEVKRKRAEGVDVDAGIPETLTKSDNPYRDFHLRDPSLPGRNDNDIPIEKLREAAKKLREEDGKDPDDSKE